MASCDALVALLDVKLNDQNYHIWACTVRMLLRGIGLASHLTDKAPVEEEVGTEAAAAWRISDDRVMAILCMSAEEPVRLSFIGLSSAREMWEYLKQRYEHNWALKLTLMERLRVLRQQDMSIQEFYNEFTRITWQLDCMMLKTCHDAHDCCEAREKFNQKFRLMDFLVRLRPEFKSTVEELVARPTLTMDEALNDLIIKEVSLSAAQIKTVCSHCKGSGHTAERC